LGNHPGPSPRLPHTFSSTNGSVSKKRNATRSKKYEEERRRFEEEARRRELEEHAREQECAHWGAHSLDTAGTKA
jgi:hypothetical protein